MFTGLKINDGQNVDMVDCAAAARERRAVPHSDDTRVILLVVSC